MAWMGHLPALATPKVEQALVICFGTGQTANAVRQHRPAALQVVDVSAAVLGAADPLHIESRRTRRPESSFHSDGRSRFPAPST